MEAERNGSVWRIFVFVMIQPTRRQLVVSCVTFGFCFLYSLLYLPENWEKRADWVLSPEVFHSPHNLPGYADLLSFLFMVLIYVCRSLRLYLAFIVALTVSTTVLLGSMLHHFAESSASHARGKKVVQQTSIPALIKEYSLLLTVGSTMYCSVCFLFVLPFHATYVLCRSTFGVCPFLKITVAWLIEWPLTSS